MNIQAYVAHFMIVDFTKLSLSKPTRLDNILDLVLVNDSLIVNKLTVTCPLGNSDHKKVEFELITAIPARRTAMQSYQLSNTT